MSREPLTDLDADLRRLLSVTPSPQFMARVRTRISGESMARAWWSGLDKRAIPHPGPAVPLDAALEVDRARVDPLVASRRDEIISIGE